MVEQASSTEFTENLSLLISEDYSGGDGGEPSDTVITSRLTEVQPSSTQLSAILDTTIYLSSFYHLSFIYLSHLYNLSCILYIYHIYPTLPTCVSISYVNIWFLHMCPFVLSHIYNLIILYLVFTYFTHPRYNYLSISTYIFLFHFYYISVFCLYTFIL